MYATRMPSGALLVPFRLFGPKGLIGEGRRVVAIGSPVYRRWSDHVLGERGSTPRGPIVLRVPAAR
jgi:hypothetical protein